MSDSIDFCRENVQILITQLWVDVELQNSVDLLTGEPAVFSCVVYDYDSTVELQDHQVEVWSTPDKLEPVDRADNGRQIFGAVVRLLKAHPPRVSFSRGVVDRFSR